jgi:hypothetical protein
MGLVPSLSPPPPHLQASPSDIMPGKSDDTVIEEFNEYVNMSVKELEAWLEVSRLQRRRPSAAG